MTKSLLTMLFIGSISTAAMAKLTGHAAHCEGVVNQKPQVTSGIETTMTFDMALKYEDNILQEIYPVGN
ncbi:MAG TPA: hypothetical protein VN132_14070, partial [Bdellovibrio sp.]|nr:hypothetical protein [Bdellovibrio sp.]